MQSARSEWIYVTYDGEGEESRVDAVQVIFHSYGTAYAGVVEGFIFEAEPQQSGVYEREDDGISVIERMPVTEPPHHWYWRKIDR